MAYEGGYSSGANQLSEMQSRDVMNAMRAQAMQAQFQEMQQRQRQQAAQAQWGGILKGMMGGGMGAQPQPGMQPPGMPPPPPGTPQGGPMPPGPGVSSQPAAPPQAPPQGPPGGGLPPPPAAAPAAGPPMPPPPFKPMPTEPPAPAAAPGMVPPPPVAPPQPMAGAGGTPGGQFALPQLLEGLKKSGVPPEQWASMLDSLPEPVKAHAAAEIKASHDRNQALIQWAGVQVKERQADAQEKRVSILEDAEARKQQQGDERIALQKQKLGKKVGGSANIVKWETDDSGNVVGGFTRTGKHVKLDDPGTAKSKIEDFDDQDTKYWTEVLQKGGSLPPRLATTPGGKALLAKVMKGAARGDVAPVEMLANQAEFMGEKAGQRTLGTRTANIEMAATEAQALSGLALKASEGWKRTGMKSLNDVEKAVQSRTASPELRQFVAANTSFINAYARAINPQGVGTVADKEHAREMLEVGFSKGDYAAAIKQLQAEIGAATASPGTVKESMRERFTGGKPKPPAAGEVKDGYRFKGGDPAKRESWEKVA